MRRHNPTVEEFHHLNGTTKPKGGRIPLLKSNKEATQQNAVWLHISY